ncbi:hypothetical protein IFJ82_15400 [Novacetimonas hansenii]|uniref:hypothetical protein n=1 Tax=Novacetimonas hansenii TaxID=436 RepID=UPI0007912D48|nr:hypothetical protein [Novacetimonas hansenii]MBL7236312.1 hypothetical protein [Novacetimonas hansenii]QOF95146.1 hypothetical protein IFJ82_15400 [Novacetimonas hansenii]WEQ57933.1 hypothetical protein LV563_08480 [Novacetimonas hansenii]CUW46154.1 hypothetical protein ATCC53582_00239 [Novacetimonas hansenii]
MAGMLCPATVTSAPRMAQRHVFYRGFFMGPGLLIRHMIRYPKIFDGGTIMDMDYDS